MPFASPLVLAQILVLIIVVLCVDNAHARQERRIMKGVSDCGNYPWVIKTITIAGEEQLCSGSLLSGKWVLTAAHCIQNEEGTGYVNVQGTSIQVGCSDVTSEKC